ncbi:DUF6270 domain-containing protein [Cupriavidus necator]|uniref:DUF6270 domain-containing protein n=1 Tax=Cupriavidus necator TaxID=106590 RepID=UPI0039C3D712
MAKILILGSCVSRDLFEYDDKNTFDLIGYFARSSFASLASRPLRDRPDTSQIASAFQRRTVGFDIDRAFLDELDGSSFDALVIDLIDERFDLFEYEPSAYITVSTELVNAGCLEGISKSDRRWVTSGSTKHRALWLQGMVKLVTALKRHGALAKVIVNKVFWSAEMDDGSNPPSEIQSTPFQYANRHLEWMYAKLAQILKPEQFISHRAEHLRLSHMHRWGLAPFHYTKGYYVTGIESLRRHMNSMESQHSVEEDKVCLGSGAWSSAAHVRVIESLYKIAIPGPDQKLDDEFTVTALRVRGNSKVSFGDDGHSIFSFAETGDTHQILLELSRDVLATGLGVSIRLRGWSHIRYVAIGYTFEGSFRHIKVVNPLLEAWTAIDFGHDDIAFGLQNGWSEPGDASISDIRLYIKGQRSSDEAYVDLREATIWKARKGDFPVADLGNGIATASELIARGRILEHFPQVRPGLLEVTYAYLEKCFRDARTQAQRFMEQGDAPLYGNVNLDWAVGSQQPAELGQVGTYRFSWHALHPAAILLMEFRRTSSPAYLGAARSFVESWLNESYDKPDKDKKFAWYDHGTAERLLCLVLMWCSGVEHRFDHRFMARLLMTIHRHAVLLHSEMFYASHQPTRYHNHAWFQDLALLATSLALDSLPAAHFWRETALARLVDQFGKLIVRDSGFAVFVENSIGYHQGVQRIVEFAGGLAGLASGESSIAATARELSQFSNFFRYPDNRAPAHGDTFRRANPSGDDIRRLKPYGKPEAVILPKAGYAIVKGIHENARYMLTFLATSLCKTHKHEDNLSFTLFFDGIEWLIDPSFFSHEYSAPLPAYLRSAAAHNALAVAGRQYSTEPGVADMEGEVTAGDYRFKGEHHAYGDIVISRELRGAIDSLTVEFRDRASLVNGHHGAEGNLELFLHCGEGVTAKCDGALVVLSHPDSIYCLEVDLPGVDVRLYFGKTDGDIIRGVTGLAFMQSTSIYTIACSLPYDEELGWRLRAKLKDVHQGRETHS